MFCAEIRLAGVCKDLSRSLWASSQLRRVCALFSFSVISSKICCRSCIWKLQNCFNLLKPRGGQKQGSSFHDKIWDYNNWKYYLEKIFWKEKLKSFTGSLGSDLFPGKETRQCGFWSWQPADLTSWGTLGYMGTFIWSLKTHYSPYNTPTKLLISKGPQVSYLQFWPWGSIKSQNAVS